LTINTKQKFGRSSWRYFSYGIAGLVLAPVITVFSSWLLPIQTSHWKHLADHLLAPLIWQTAGLLLGVCTLTFIVGVSLAWLCSQFKFPGSAILKRGLILPFAIPAYVNAFVYVGLLDYAGPVQTWMRNVLGADFEFPQARSLPGGILFLTLSLFPYVYLFTYDAFSSQGRRGIEAARSLGASSFSSFYRLALPFARPWIAGALCLVSLEVLNDFGAVSIVGVDTFTTAIYKVWFGFFSPETAAQLATILILFAFFLYYFEQALRSRQRYTSNQPLQPSIAHELRGFKAWAASLYGWFVFTLSFLLPVFQLAVWASEKVSREVLIDLLPLLWRTLVLGTMVGGTACFFALIVCMAKRYTPTSSLKLSLQVAQLGYGIPGSVLAIGIYLVVVKLDHKLADVLEFIWGHSGQLLLSGAAITMILALTIRFLAVGITSLEAGLARVSTRLDEVAKLYGVYGFRQFLLLHGPLLKKSFASGFLLVFVEVVKEMPLTLMTRPFGWDSLSVRIYGLTSEGEWAQASLPALFLILIGALPLFLIKQNHRS
jgi:iron(III) transport system permease protein